MLNPDLEICVILIEKPPSQIYTRKDVNTMLKNVLVRGAIKLQPSSYGQRVDKQNSLVMKAQAERRSESTEQRRACGNLSVKTEVVVRCLEKVAEACRKPLGYRNTEQR